MSSADARLYSPNRDIAHNFASVLTEVMERHSKGRWPALQAMLSSQGVTEAEMDQALDSYARFIILGKDKPEASMIDLLTETGYLQCPPAAQIAVMALLGTVYSGIQFVGVREATVAGEGPLLSVSQLVEQSRLFQQAAGLRTQSRWEQFQAALARFLFGK